MENMLTACSASTNHSLGQQDFKSLNKSTLFYQFDITAQRVNVNFSKLWFNIFEMFNLVSIENRSNQLYMDDEENISDLKFNLQTML